MRCSNCGANVPFAGNVCPLCHAEKSSDQMMQVSGILCAFIGGGIGWLIAKPCAGPIIGVIVGMIVGMIVGGSSPKPKT